MKKIDFVKQASEKHTINYNYSSVDEKLLKNKNNSIYIICPEHGLFKQQIAHHLKGGNCPSCSYRLRGSKRTLNYSEKFIAKAKTVHGDIYTYKINSLVKSTSRIGIVCPSHGTFYQVANSHLQGSGCPVCAGNTLTQEAFIDKLKILYGDTYDFSETVYVNNKTKVSIICKKHGSVKVAPSNLLAGHSCGLCGIEKRASTQSYKTEDFIKKARSVHRDLYDYSKVDYKNSKTKVEIVCRTHGSFFQVPSYHFSGNGCPTCSSSKGELTIEHILNEKNIRFEKQYKMNGCKNKRSLPFDFAIFKGESLVGCIEYNGGQHYFPVQRWGGEETFRKIQYRDSIKQNFCKDKGIHLLTIPYNEDNIEQKLVDFLIKRGILV